MDPTQKHQESIVLEGFRKHFTGFPKGRLVPSEAPDFILKTGPRRAIGIELTALKDNHYVLNASSLQTFLIHLHQAIGDKTDKLRRYRKNRLNEYWLILHADSIDHKIPEFEERLRDSIPVREFDRVFLFALFEGKFWELPAANG